jgi:hypothetical protein
VNTRWNSWATPIAATPVRPSRISRSRYGRITSSLRWPLAKRTTSISLSRANSVTALRNRNPILSRIAGDGIGNPRCPVRKLTTWPDICRLGTNPLR